MSPRSLRSDTSVGLAWNKRTGLRVRAPCFVHDRVRWFIQTFARLFMCLLSTFYE